MKRASLLFPLLFFALSPSHVWGQQDRLVELQKQLQQAADDSSRVNAYYDLYDFFSRKDIDKAALYLDSARVDNAWNRSLRGTAERLKMEGLYQRQLDEPRKSIDLLSQAAVLYDSLGDMQQTQGCYYGIGGVNRRIGAYAEANNAFLEATRIAELRGDSVSISNCYNALGVVQRRMDNYHAALKHYETSLRFAPETHYVGRVNNLINMGVVSKRLNRQEEALAQFAAATELVDKYTPEDLDAYAYIYNNTSSTYYSMGDFDRALTYIDKSLVIRRQLAGAEELFSALIGSAAATTKMRRFKEANAFLQEAEPLAASHIQKRELYAAYSDLYKDQGDYKQALNNLNQMQKYKDSLYQEETLRQITEINTQYEVEKKDRELQLLGTENSLAELRLASNRRTIAMLVLGLLLAGGLLLYMRKLYREIRKADQEKAVLLKEIHHRVKNNLQVISSLLKLQAHHLQDDQAVAALQKGQHRVESMALIHRDLYQQDNLSGVNTRVYLRELVQKLVSSYQLDKTDVQLDMDIAPLWLDVDTMIPMGLVINELISNALKHAFKDRDQGQLKIALQERDDTLVLKIKDDGLHQFDPEEQHGTFGHSLIKSFAQKLKADLSYDFEGGFGVELVIRSYRKAA